MSKRWFCCLGIPVLLLFALFLALEIPHIFQEGNPLPLLPALSALRKPGVDIVEVTSNPKLLIGRMDGKHAGIDRYMARRGWTRNDQWGSVLPYHRGKEELKVMIRIFLHGRYWAYELDRRP